MPATVRKASGKPRAAVRRKRGVSCAGLFLGLIVLFSLTASPAAARELRIHSFNVELDVLPDSTLTVTETIGAEFLGSWNGFIRTIPVVDPGPGGFNYSL